MVAHEKRNSAQLFCAVPTRNDLALSFLFFHRPTHRKVGIAMRVPPSLQAAASRLHLSKGWGTMGHIIQTESRICLCALTERE